MSYLYGNVEKEKIYPITSPYGEKLNEAALIECDGCSDLCLSDDKKRLFVARSMAVDVYDVTNGMPRKTASCEMPGNARQMVYFDGILYVTCRDAGLNIIDVKAPDFPKFIRRIDTLELATGVSVSGNILCICNRHMGLEFYDVSVPSKPEYLSSCYAGEAQSVYISGNTVAVGDWVNQTLWLISIDDVRAPRVLSKTPLDGYGDGVFIRGNLCYAATGHHSRRLENRVKYAKFPFVTAEMLNDGYGGGHGLEIFDITDPASPKSLSKTKFPPYFGGCDTWRVFCDGRYAYCCDTGNGMYCLDVTDPTAPDFKAYFKPKAVKAINCPTVQTPSAQITSAAAANGKLFVASIDTGFYVIDDFAVNDFDGRGIIEERKSPAYHCGIPQNNGVYFCAGGQAHSVAFSGDVMAVAAGDGGMYAVDRGSGEIIGHLDGMIYDVESDGEIFFAALGYDGIAAYRFCNKEFVKIASAKEALGKNLRQVVLAGNGVIVAECYTHQIAFFKFDGEKLEYTDTLKSSYMLYHRHICRGTLGKYIATMPLACAELWFDPTLPALVKGGRDEMACPFEDGIALAGDYGVIVNSGKLYFIDESYITGGTVPKSTEVEGADVHGMPFIVTADGGDILVLTERIAGRVCLIDISDHSSPKHIRTVQVPGHPEFAKYEPLDNTILICCGREGVVKLKMNNEY